MNYQFPIIRHIDDVLPHIEGNKSFIVADRDDFKVVNYVIAGSETFPDVSAEKDKILRECRGLVFCGKSGVVLSRRYHKFFNLGERQETLKDVVDFSKPHVILEKLDGSMISPLVFGENVRWSTKMGITDTSMQTEEFVALNQHYRDFALFCHSKGLTPIFEWCSRQNRIVVDHPEDRLILTAIRKTVEGDYYSLKRVQALAFFFGIPVVKVKFIPSNKTADEIEQAIRGLEETEGIVVRFNDGHMVKVKSEWYVRIHKAKEFITTDRLKIEAILSEKLDDVLPFLPEGDKEAVLEFQKELMVNISQFVYIVLETMIHVEKTGMTRKDFALWSNPAVTPLMKRVVFKCWEKGLDNVYTSVIELVKNSTTSNGALEKTAEIWRT